MIPVLRSPTPPPPASKSINCHENQPRLRHEGIKDATVTRIALLAGPIPLRADPRKEHDYDDVDDDGDDTNPQANAYPNHATPLAEGAQADPNPEPLMMMMMMMMLMMFMMMLMMMMMMMPNTPRRPNREPHHTTGEGRYSKQTQIPNHTTV